MENYSTELVIDIGAEVEFAFRLCMLMVPGRELAIQITRRALQEAAVSAARPRDAELSNRAIIARRIWLACDTTVPPFRSGSEPAESFGGLVTLKKNERMAVLCSDLFGMTRLETEHVLAVNSQTLTGYLVSARTQLLTNLG